MTYNRVGENLTLFGFYLLEEMKLIKLRYS